MLPIAPSNSTRETPSSRATVSWPNRRAPRPAAPAHAAPAHEAGGGRSPWLCWPDDPGPSGCAGPVASARGGLLRRRLDCSTLSDAASRSPVTRTYQDHPLPPMGTHSRGRLVAKPAPKGPVGGGIGGQGAWSVPPRERVGVGYPLEYSPHVRSDRGPPHDSPPPVPSRASRYSVSRCRLTISLNIDSRSRA